MQESKGKLIVPNNLTSWTNMAYWLIAMMSFGTHTTAADTKVNANSKEVEEVFVEGNTNTSKFESSERTKKLMQTAGTFGDPIQAIFSLPGIVQIDEEDTNPAVQGSSPAANQFLIDDIPVDFIFHPFGDSIFNENLIRDFGLNTAGFGARYGEATGAIFNVSLRAPKNKPMETTLDLGLLRLGGLVEGAITKSQSFYFSYRESLIPLYLQASNIEEEEDISIEKVPRATDYQSKYFWRLDDEESLTFQASGAIDTAGVTFGDESEEALLDPGLEGDAKVDIEFHSQGLTWEKKNTKVVFAHIFSKEKINIGSGEFFDIKQYNWVAKALHSWTIRSDHLIAVGGSTEHRRYKYSFDSRIDNCTDFSNPNCEFDLGDRLQDARTQNITLFNAYIEDEWKINDEFILTSGLHLSADNYLDNKNLDPRLRLEWTVNEKLSMNTSIGRYHQLPNEGDIFPVIGNPDLDTISATHYVIGGDYIFSEAWNVSSEIYYKDIDNLVVGTEDIIAAPNTPYLNEGEGKAYGLQLMLTKEHTTKWYGWLALSLSKTERTNLLNNVSTPFSYDVPINTTLVVNYQMTRRWNVGGRWTYRSGSLYTPITGNRDNPQFPGFYIPVYGELNSKRIRNYHRLDIRFEMPFHGKKGLLFFDILNIYNRKNTSGIEYIPIANSSEFEVKDTEGLGFIPSVGVKYTF